MHANFKTGKEDQSKVAHKERGMRGKYGAPKWRPKNFFAAKIGREEVSPRGKEHMAEASEEKEPVLIPCVLCVSSPMSSAITNENVTGIPLIFLLLAAGY